jgi:2-iminobutanoate/2-iminopropanoate deaminase
VICVTHLFHLLIGFLQYQNQNEMKKNIINPWNWQDARSYAQAVEVKNTTGTLYVSGQGAINEEGISSKEDMCSQLVQTIQNVEKVIQEAHYEVRNIVRLTIYTTSNTELLENFDLFQHWITKNEIKQALTVVEVKSLFESLKVEFEATVVK